jgi:hypothetical protein
MTKALYTCAKAPCKSCPYRKDVPSGVWAKAEYNKLPYYDGDTSEQFLKAEAFAMFFCHQNDGKLCAGWLGTHGPTNLLAMRLHSANVDPEVFGYESPVPLFASGAEAAAHGKKAMKRPGTRARRTIEILLRKRERNLRGPRK